MSQKKLAGLSALPLGGVGECGSLNMMCYECDGDMIVVDSGIGFPHQYTPGIDAIVQDVTYIRENIDRVKAIIITHAHWDHIGSLHYLWEEIQAPVYCTKFAHLVIENNMEQVGLGGEVPYKIHETGDRFELGNFDIEFVGLTHSVPESHALMIRTSRGNILHTGDFKFEKENPVGAHTCMDRLAEIGKEDIRAMFIDSTSVMVKKHAGDETDVAKSIKDLVAGCKNRVYFCTITSHIARIASAFEAAMANGRKVAVFGRSMIKMVDNGHECGYITKEMMANIVDINEAMSMPKRNVMIMVTGSQAQQRSALTRLAYQDMPQMQLSEGDDVVLSSLWIPGNEKAIGDMVSGLEYRGATVHHMHNNRGIYASGHPYEGDVKKMYEIMKPETAIPVHGDYQQMKANAALAKKCGVPYQILFENGRKLQLDDGEPYVEDYIYPNGRLYVDGLNILDEDRFIMKERVKLSEAGIAVVTIAVDEQSGKMLSKPKVNTRGLLDANLQPEIIQSVIAEISDTLEIEFKDGVIDRMGHAKQMITRATNRAFNRERGRKPVVMPIIVQI